MRRSIVFLNVAAAVVLAGTARANFVLTGTEHLNVNTSHTTGVLYDSSTADVTGGYVSYLYANDTSSVNVSGGSVGYLRAVNDSSVDVSSGTIFNYLHAYDNSSVNVSGGTISGYLRAHNDSSVDVSGGSAKFLTADSTSSVNFSGGRINYELKAFDTSSVNVSGGSVNYLYAYNTSSVHVSGGTISNNLYAYNDSSVHVSGGTISNNLYAYNDSSVHVSGSSISPYLYAYDTSSVDVSGGSISNSLYAYNDSSVHVSGGSVNWLDARDTSNVALHGYDFQATRGLTLNGEEVLGTGLLTGKWFDGTSWAVTIDGNYPTATIRAAVLAPSVASFAGAPTLVHDIDFGTVNPGDSVPGEPFAIWNLADPKWSMNLDLLSIVGSGDTGPLTANLSPFTDLAAGQSHSFTAWMCPSEPGDFAASYALNFSDRLGSGSCQTITLNLRGSVVPEPSTLVLLATGTLGLTVGWWRRRRR